MCPAMEGMYESAKTYANVLKNCSLPQVVDWTLEEVDRVIQWGEYFENVQARITKRHSLIRKLDNKLRDIGRDFGVRFGEEEFSYDFLSHSSDYFTKCLLDNPVLPEELREKISETSPHLAKQHLSEVEDAKLLFSSMSAIHEKLVPYQGSDADLLDLKSLDAEYLRKDLGWALGGGESGKGWPSVGERLDSLASIEGGMEVILLSLLQGEDSLQWLTPHEPSHDDLLDPARRAILDWLLQTARTWNGREGGRTIGTPGRERCILDGLWKEKHCKLLSQVSLRYLDFFKEHLKFLFDRTKEMERERGDVNLGMEGDSSEAWREIKQMGLFLEVETGREKREDASSAGVESSSETGKRKLVVEQRERKEEMQEHMDVDSSETVRGKREDSSLGVEEAAVNVDSARELPMDERVAWAIAHWVELVQAGGQVKEVCLSLLLKGSQQLSWIKQEELTYAGHTLALPPPADSVWKVVLAAVHSKMQKF